MIATKSKPSTIVSESANGRQKARRSLRNLIMLLIGTGLLTVLLRHVSLSQLAEVLSRADVRYLLTAFLVGLATTAFRTIRYGCFFPARGRWLELYGAFAFMRLLNFALPFRSGEMVFLGMLKKYRLSPSIAETAPVWLLLRATDVGILSVLCAFTLSVSSLPGTLDERLQWVPCVLMAACVMCFVLMFCLPIGTSGHSNVTSRGWLSQRLQKFRAGLSHIRSIRAFLRTLCLAALIWGAMVTVMTSAQLAFGTPLHFRDSCLLSVAVLIITLLPINAPLGIGTGEAAWAGLMIIFGVEAAEAIAIAISVRLVFISVIMTDGLIGVSLLLVRRSRNTW